MLVLRSFLRENERFLHYHPREKKYYILLRRVRQTPPKTAADRLHVKRLRLRSFLKENERFFYMRVRVRKTQIWLETG